MDYKTTFEKLCYYSLHLIPFLGSIFVGYYIGEKYVSYYNTERYIVKSGKENLRTKFGKTFFRKNIIIPTAVLAGRLVVTGLYSFIDPNLPYSDLSGMAIGIFSSVADIRTRERIRDNLLEDISLPESSADM